MSHRVTRVMTVNISAGVFPTYEAATKEANAIKIWLQRLCEKHGYSCKGAIGISMHNPQTGCVTTKKNGGKGRPTKVFERNTGVMLPTMTEAHIHMVLYCNPASTIIDKLAERINDKFHTRAAWVKDCKKYVDAAVNYLFKQSLKVRTINFDRNDILSADEFGFCRAVDEAVEQYRNTVSFTKSEAAETKKTIDNKGVSVDSEQSEELLCNSLSKTTTDNSDVHTLRDSNLSHTYKESNFPNNREDTLLQRYIDNIHTLYSYFQKLFQNLENIHISSIHCMDNVPDEEYPDYSP